MARGPQGAIVTRFDADYSGLEDGAKTAVNIISEFDTKGKKATTALTVSTRDAGNAIKSFGREVSRVDPILGQLIVIVGKNKAAMGSLAKVITNFGSSIVSFISQPAAIAAGAVAGLTAGIGYLLYKLVGTNERIKEVQQAMEDFAKSTAKYNAAIDQAVIASSVFNDVQGELRIRADAAQDELKSLVGEFKQLLGIKKTIDAIEKLNGKLSVTENEFRRLIDIISLKQYGTHESLEAQAATDIGKLILRYRELQKELDGIRSRQESIKSIGGGGFVGAPGVEHGVSSSIAAFQQVSNQLATQQIRAAESYRGGAMTFGTDFAIQNSIDGYNQLGAMMRQIADEKQRQIDLEKELAAASREATQQQLQDMQDKVAYAEMYNVAMIQAQQMESSKLAFQEWGASLEANMADVYAGIMQVTDMAVQGFGDAVANAIVYQEDFGKAMADLGKQVAASVISMLVQIGIQQLIYFAIGKALLLAETSAKLAAQMAIGSAAAAASAFSAVPFPGNFGAALAAGEMASALIAATAESAASTGRSLAPSIVGAKRGALTLGEGVIHVHSDEIIAPRSDYERLMGKNRRASPFINVIELDGRELARSVVEYLPGAVRRSGVRGF